MRDTWRFLAAVRVCAVAGLVLFRLLWAVAQLAALKLVPADDHRPCACCVSTDLQLLAVQQGAAALGISCRRNPRCRQA